MGSDQCRLRLQQATVTTTVCRPSDIPATYKNVQWHSDVLTAQ